MIKRLLHIASLLLLQPVSAIAQPDAEPIRLVIWTRDSLVNSGFFHSIDRDSLFLAGSGRIEAVGLDELVRVDRLPVIRIESGWNGMMLGFYGGAVFNSLSSSNLSYGSDGCEQCRVGFVWNLGGSVVAGFFASLLFGGAGSLADGSGNSLDSLWLRSVKLDADPLIRREQLAELDAGLKAPASRWSLGFYGGVLFGTMLDDATDDYASAGYSLGRFDPDASSSTRDNVGRAGEVESDYPSPFQMFRRVGLHYRIGAGLEAGINAVSLGDPGFVGSRVEPFGRSIRVFAVGEGTSGFAWFAGGRYRPFGNSRSGLGLTAGAGIAPLDFRRSGYIDSVGGGINDVDNLPISQSESAVVAAGLVAAEFTLSFTAAISIGISADYVVTTAATMPGLPALKIPERKIWPGNASVGFVLGWNF